MNVNETISPMFPRNPDPGSPRRIFISRVIVQVVILKGWMLNSPLRLMVRYLLLLNLNPTSLHLVWFVEGRLVRG